MNLGEEDKSIPRIPILPDDKLIEFSNRFLYINISKEEINNALPEVIVVLYEAFLKDFGFNIDALSQPYWQATEILEGNFENYEETIPLLNLFVLLKLVAARSGINDFSIKDIMETKRKRTRRILSYFANYWQFSALSLQEWLKIKEEYKEIADKRKQLLDDIDKIKQTINEQKKILNSEKYQNSKVKEECQYYIESFDKITKSKAEVTEKYQKLKQKFAEKKESLSGINVEISTLMERKKQLESKIVSREQKKELEDMADKLQLYSQKNEEIFSKIDEYKKLKNSHVKMLENLNKILEFFSDLNKEINKERDFNAEINDICIANKALEEKFQNLNRQLDQKNTKLAQLEEWNQKEEMNHRKQIQQLKLLIDKQERCIGSKQGETVTKELELKKKKIIECIQEKKIERRKLDQEVNKLTTSIVKMFEDFGKKISRRLEIIQEELEILQNRHICFDDE